MVSVCPAKAASGAAKTIVGNGTKVAIRVEGAGPAKDADLFRKQLVEKWTRSLESQGIKIAADAPVTLVMYSDFL